MSKLTLLIILGTQLNCLYSTKYTKDSRGFLDLKSDGTYEYSKTAWSHWFIYDIEGQWFQHEDTLVLNEEIRYFDVFRVEYERNDSIKGVKVEFEEINGNTIDSIYLGINFAYIKARNQPKWQQYYNIEKGEFIIESENEKGIQINLVINDDEWFERDYIDEDFNLIRLKINSKPKEITKTIQHKYLIKRNKLIYLEVDKRGHIISGIFKAKRRKDCHKKEST